MQAEEFVGNKKIQEKFNITRFFGETKTLIFFFNNVNEFIVNTRGPTTVKKNEEEMGRQHHKSTTQSKAPTVKSTSLSSHAKDKQSTEKTIKLQNRLCLLTDNEL